MSEGRFNLIAVGRNTNGRGDTLGYNIYGPGFSVHDRGKSAEVNFFDNLVVKCYSSSDLRTLIAKGDVPVLGLCMDFSDRLWYSRKHMVECVFNMLIGYERCGKRNDVFQHIFGKGLDYKIREDDNNIIGTNTYRACADIYRNSETNKKEYYSVIAEIMLLQSNPTSDSDIPDMEKSKVMLSFYHNVDANYIPDEYAARGWVPGETVNETSGSVADFCIPLLAFHQRWTVYTAVLGIYEFIEKHKLSFKEMLEAGWQQFNV